MKDMTKMMNKIKTSEAFVAVISENFIADEKKIEECRYAEKLNKPMYAIIKDKQAWDKIKNRFMWRKAYPFGEDSVVEMKDDLNIIRAVNDM